jgi:glycosyltransferase involved in cell wall biosynthesis
MARPRVLFFYQKKTTFVADDLRILERHYNVDAFEYDVDLRRSFTGRGMEVLSGAMQQALWLTRRVARADLLVGWFNDYHMVLPALCARKFGKPLVLFLGGFECNHVPQLQHGIFHSTWRAPLARFAYRRASMLLPVSEALMHRESAFVTWPEKTADGLKVHMPDLDVPYQVIPFGMSSQWLPGADDRGKTVCSVAMIDRERTFLRKGIDLLIRAAHKLPDVSFTVVGIAPHYEKEALRKYSPPDNVIFLPPRSRDELASLYATNAVYLQVSRSEGMPNVLLEAMASGCIPVGSDVSGIPEAMGDVGLIVNSPDSDVIASAIRDALAMGGEDRRRVRGRVNDLFRIDLREERIVSVMNRLLESKAGKAGD